MATPRRRTDIAPAPVHQRLGIAITRATPEEVVGTVPVAGNTQPVGLLHGGVSALLAESLASIGAALAAGPDQEVVGIELSISHHRSVGAGTVTGRASPLRHGSTVSCWQVVVEDDQGRRLSTARVTCLVRSSPGSPGA
ncbi:MAG: hotdog fold thioesterase [Actinomycetota bacterium]|nr:hotdog fold thioesterase [Actinomycetota bacterium]